MEAMNPWKKKMESVGTLNEFCYRFHVVLVHVVNMDVNDDFHEPKSLNAVLDYSAY